MAQWMNQTFDVPRWVTMTFEEKQVLLDQKGEPHGCIILDPETRDEAHTLAKALRMAARRLEAIGLDLPEVG